MASLVNVTPASQVATVEVTNRQLDVTVQEAVKVVDITLQTRGGINVEISRSIATTGVQEIIAGNGIAVSSSTGIVTISTTGDTGNAYHANIADVANSVAGANVTGTVANATNATFAAVANSVAGANVSGTVANATNAQYAVVADSANSVAGANVIGVVANASHANVSNIANSVAGANVTGIVASANQANTANIATVAYYIDGSNVNGYVANALHATVADSANLVTGANVQGYVAEATHALASDVATTANSVAGANVTGTVANASHATISNSANSVAVANVSGIGNIATVNLDGNVSNVLHGDGSWASAGDAVNANYANFAGTAFSVTGSNVSGDVAGANHANISDVANSVAGSNVSGAVSYATVANSVAVANVTGIGNIATVNLTGSSTDVLYGNGIFAPAGSAGIPNYANYAGTAFSVDGGNVVGTVSDASHATVADSANSVAGSNVSGAVSLATFATTANAVAGANVSGVVANATHAIHSDEANSVTGANVIGYVSDANHATIANIANIAYSVDGANVSGQVSNALVSGTVYSNAQPNITSVGTLTDLSVTGNIQSFADISGAYIYGNGAFLTGVGNLSAARGYWGSFFSNVTQTIASTTTAYAITLNNTDPDSYGIYISSNSHINFTYAGNYNVQFSSQFVNPTASPIEVDIWIRINGVDVPESRGVGFVVDKQGAVNGQAIISWNYILPLNANDYVEFMWHSESTSLTMENIPAGTTPTTPSAPSIIITAQQVTNVQPVELQGSMTGNISGNGFSLINIASISSLDGITGNTFTGNGAPLTNLTGANVVGAVANATHATIADASNVAYSVSGSNVVGDVAGATHANISDAANVAYSVSGANVTSAVAYATVANSVAGANVSGQVGNSLIAGTVYTNAQPNITSVGTLTSVSSSGNITAPRFISNIATGNAPFIVTSTTLVANLNVANANSATQIPYSSGALPSSIMYLPLVQGAGYRAAYIDDSGTGVSFDSSNNTLIATEFEGRLVDSPSGTTYVAPSANDIKLRVSGTDRLIVNATGANVTGNVNATVSINAPRFVSNVATGTAPFTVTSTTLVPNLNVATSNIANTANNFVATNQTTGLYRLVFGSTTNNGTANTIAASFNGNINANAATGTLIANTFTSTIATGTAPFTVTSTTQVANLSVATAGTVTTAAQPNITSLGTLTSLSVTGNISGDYFIGNGSQLTGVTVTDANHANIADVANSVAGANVSGYVADASHATIADSANLVIGANVSGTVASATIAQTVTTNAQPNITSVGLLTSLDVSGNIFSNTAVYVGNTSNATGLTNPTIVAKASGATYVQAAIVNGTPEGSADWVSYGDNGSDSGAWADMGFTGSNFSDPIYTITGINDGYFFVQGDDSSAYGGNLVIATGTQGSTKDIVFATGGFSTSNEKMRFINATNQFYIQPTTSSTDTTTGALRVAGGVGIGGDVYAGNVVSANFFIGDGGLLSNITFSGSVSNANYSNFAGEAYSVSAGNISGTVNLANYATVANSVAGANVSGAVTYATTANAVAGSNVSGEVANAAYATIAGTAYSVSAANISGTVNLANFATVANSVAGANVSGAVTYATTANSVAVANVVGIGNIATTNYNGNGSQVLYGNGVFAAVSGGSGSPGGANTQLQFNDSGTFGGISTVTWNGSNLSLGAVGNVKVTGGSSGQVISTDGTGNLSFVDQSGGGGGSTGFEQTFLMMGA